MLSPVEKMATGISEIYIRKVGIKKRNFYPHLLDT